MNGGYMFDALGGRNLVQHKCEHLVVARQGHRMGWTVVENSVPWWVPGTCMELPKEA